MEDNTNLPLSPDEWAQWTNLTKRIKFIDGKIPIDAFYAFCEAFISPVIDMAPYRYVDKKIEILLIYRKDKYYDGFHLPGSVITPGKTSKETLESVIKNELGNNVKVNKTHFIKIMDTMKGQGIGLDTRGQDLKLLYACEVGGEVLDGEWFKKNNLPDNIIPEHQNVVLDVFDYLNKNIKND
jgi:hypothetical protein